MSDKLQMPHSKQKRDGEIRIMSNGTLIEMRGNYTKEEIIKAATSLIEEESGYSVGMWEKLGRHSQAWYKAVPDGSGEYTWVAHGGNVPRRGSYFASCLYLY